MEFVHLLDNSDILYEISKHLETNDIINFHLAYNIYMSVGVLRLLDKYIMCISCCKYEKELYECYYCKKKNCLYCLAKCKKCKMVVCNAFGCDKENEKCTHNFTLMMNKYNCRNHKTICSMNHKSPACECKKGIKCTNCLCILCAGCGQSGLCKICDGYA